MPIMRRPSGSGGGGTSLGAMAMRRLQAAQAAQSATVPMAAHPISTARMPYLGGASVVNYALRANPNVPKVGAPLDTNAPSAGGTGQSPAGSPSPSPDSSGDGSGGGGGGDGSGDGSDQSQTPTSSDGGDANDTDSSSDDETADAEPVSDDEPDNVRVVDYDTDNPDGIPVDDEEDAAVDNGSDYAGDPPPSFPLVASHIQDGQLRTYAFLQTPYGCMPIVTNVRLPDTKGVKNGWVTFAGDYGIFGIDAAIRQTKGLMMKRAEKEKIRLECESLVRRARQGDQNAMALMSGVRDNAKKGDARARFALGCLQQYISRNPMSGDAAQFGDEKASDRALSFWSTVALANGAPIAMPRIIGMAASFPSDAHKDIFLNGVQFFKDKARLADIARHLDPEEKNILEMGRAIGEARALQKVRRGAPLRTLDAAMGWEMGE